jgi:hypothetical protein
MASLKSPHLNWQFDYTLTTPRAAVFGRDPGIGRAARSANATTPQQTSPTASPPTQQTPASPPSASAPASAAPPTTTPSPGPPIATSRPKRSRRTPARDDDPRYAVSSYGPRKRPDEHASVAQADLEVEPRSYSEAMSLPDAAKWEIACPHASARIQSEWGSQEERVRTTA